MSDSKKLSIYHIFIDRFAGFPSNATDTKPKWIGGNLKGIIEKLPYIKSLGMNAIWLSPFYKTSDYHGYSVTDFYEIDSHFGTKKDLKKLVSSCHASGIKVIIDYVPNHCSSLHPFFLDAQRNRNSKYEHWFTFTKWPKKYLCFLQIKELPKLNLQNRETRDYIIGNALYWVKEFDIDGLRLDHALGPSDEFWKEFSSKIKKTKQNVVLLGEVWLQGIKFRDIKTLNMGGIVQAYHRRKILGEKLQDFAMRHYAGILDGCLDFTFTKLVKDFAIKGKISENTFREKLKDHYKKFPKDFLLPTFLDNHDMNRFLFEAKGKKEKLMKAAKLQWSIHQPKIIYYGTEVGMSQEKDIKKARSHGDLAVRKKMIWDEKKQDRKLLAFYRGLNQKI